MIALSLLIKKNKNQTSDAKRKIYICAIIANTIAKQLLDAFITREISIFDNDDCFNSSENNIIKIYEVVYFGNTSNEKFYALLCSFNDVSANNT